MAQTDSSKLRSIPTPTPHKEFKSPSLSIPKQKSLIRDIGKSLSTLNNRDEATLKKNECKRVVSSRKTTTISEADMISTQKKVEKLAGRNYLLKQTIETSREEVRSHQEKSKTFINDLKSKITCNKESIIQTEKAIELMEQRRKHLEEELNIRTQERNNTYKEMLQKEQETEAMYVKEKKVLLNMGVTVFQIHKTTHQLVNLVLDRIRKEQRGDVVWRLYAWVRKYWNTKVPVANDVKVVKT